MAMLSERRKLYEIDPRRVQKRPARSPKWSPGGLRTALLCQLGLTSPPGPLGSRAWAALGRSWGALGGSWGCSEASWPLLGLSRAAPGRSWGWFWDLPGADLDVLDDVCGATRKIAKTVYFKVFLVFQSLSERSEIGPKSAWEASWTSLGTKDRSGGPS